MSGNFSRRRETLQLINRPCDALPNVAAILIALFEQQVRPHQGLPFGVFAMRFDHPFARYQNFSPIISSFLAQSALARTGSKA